MAVVGNIRPCDVNEGSLNMIALALAVLLQADADAPRADSEAGCQAYADWRLGKDGQTFALGDGGTSTMHRKAHYRASDRTCYLLLEVVDEPGPSAPIKVPSHMFNLFRPDDTAPYAVVRWIGDNPKDIVDCTIEDKPCDSYEEFDRFVQDFMNED